MQEQRAYAHYLVCCLLASRRNWKLMYLSHILLEQKQNLLSDEVNYEVHCLWNKENNTKCLKKKWRLGSLKKHCKKKKKFYKIASEIIWRILRKVWSHMKHQKETSRYKLAECWPENKIHCSVLTLRGLDRGSCRTSFPIMFYVKSNLLWEPNVDVLIFLVKCWVTIKI